MRMIPLIAVAALLAGCGSYKKDLQTMCNAPNEATEAVAAADPAQKATLLAAWIDDRIKTDEARKLFQALAAVPPEDRSRMLLEEAKKNGLAGCPLAEIFQPEPKAAEPVALPKAPADAPPEEAAPDAPATTE